MGKKLSEGSHWEEEKKPESWNRVVWPESGRTRGAPSVSTREKAEGVDPRAGGREDQLMWGGEETGDPDQLQDGRGGSTGIVEGPFTNDRPNSCVSFLWRCSEEDGCGVSGYVGLPGVEALRGEDYDGDRGEDEGERSLG